MSNLILKAPFFHGPYLELHEGMAMLTNDVLNHRGRSFGSLERERDEVILRVISAAAIIIQCALSFVLIIPSLVWVNFKVLITRYQASNYSEIFFRTNWLAILVLFGGPLISLDAVIDGPEDVYLEKKLQKRLWKASIQLNLETVPGLAEMARELDIPSQSARQFIVGIVDSFSTAIAFNWREPMAEVMAEACANAYLLGDQHLEDYFDPHSRRFREISGGHLRA